MSERQVKDVFMRYARAACDLLGYQPRDVCVVEEKAPHIVCSQNRVLIPSSFFGTAVQGKLVDLCTSAVGWTYYVNRPEVQKAHSDFLDSLVTVPPKELHALTVLEANSGLEFLLFDLITHVVPFMIHKNIGENDEAYSSAARMMSVEQLAPLLAKNVINERLTLAQHCTQERIQKFAKLQNVTEYARFWDDLDLESAFANETAEHIEARREKILSSLSAALGVLKPVFGSVALPRAIHLTQRAFYDRGSDTFHAHYPKGLSTSDQLYAAGFLAGHWLFSQKNSAYKRVGDLLKHLPAGEQVPASSYDSTAFKALVACSVYAGLQNLHASCPTDAIKCAFKLVSETYDLGSAEGVRLFMNNENLSAKMLLVARTSQEYADLCGKKTILSDSVFGELFVHEMRTKYALIQANIRRRSAKSHFSN